MPRKKLKQNSDTTSITEIIQDTTSITDNKTNMSSSDVIEISQLRGKEIWHYNMLGKFFTGCDLLIVQKMVDIINGEHLVSLRFLDWFVTRYCYLYKSTINITNNFCTQNNFNINISYKAQLKSFTKNYFDPFKRKKKFYYSLDKHDISFLTTLGQLNFFRWAITNDIVNYTETNYKIIISKYDYVNSFFKKHSSNSSSNSTTLSNLSSSNISLSNSSLESSTDNNDIYKNNNSKIIIDKKPTFNSPKVTRNICIEI
jgi:hypothetical protein